MIFENLNADNATLHLCSQYSHPSGDIEEDLLSWIPQFLDTYNVLVGGEFNVSLKTMGYTWDDDRAKTVLEYLIPSRLSIMNDPDSVCTFLQDDKTGRPDLTLGEYKIMGSLDTCEVVAQNYSHSDHQ